MRLNYRRTFFIGLAFMSICAFWQLYENIVPLILKNTFGIKDTLSGAIMALDNVLALFMLPLFGTLSDKTSTPLGKRMPFIIGGTALAVISMLFMPIGDNAGVFPVFIIALFMTLVAMSTYRSPAVALMPDVTPKPLRSKANAVINLMGAIGGAATLGIIAILMPDDAKPNYFPMFAIIAALMAVAVVVLVLTIKENKLVTEMQAMNGHQEQEEAAEKNKGRMAPEVRRSLICILLSVFFWYAAYNAVTTAFSKYAQSYLVIKAGGFATNLLIATVAAIISYIPAGFIASKIGRKKTILIGVVMMFVSFAVAGLFKSYSPVLSVLLVLIGSGWAVINVNSYPMAVEMSKGSDVGKYTGYYYTFSMSAQVLTPIASGALLEHVGYHTLFPYAAFFMALAFVTMLMVRHGDSKPAVAKDKLEMLDVGD